MIEHIEMSNRNAHNTAEGTIAQLRVHRDRHQHYLGEEYYSGQIAEGRSDTLGSRETGDIANMVEHIEMSKRNPHDTSEGGIAKLRLYRYQYQHRLGKGY